MNNKLFILVILLLVVLPIIVSSPNYAFAQITQINPDSIPFAPAVNYRVGYNLFSLFCADLDGDFDLDIAAVDNWVYVDSEGVSILKNNGNGTFQTDIYYRTGNSHRSVFCADLDGDNDQDLAVANPNSHSVSIFMNNGDGTFQGAVNYGADGPYSVFCADLDGDNDVDLAVANGNSDNVSILKNNGDGTFQTEVDYGAGDSPHSVFCADLDGDNDLDLAVANYYSGNVSILKNNGDGTFQSAVNYGAGGCPISVFCAELDGDNDVDLAVANACSDNVSILKNNSDGTFQTKVDYGAGNFPYSVFCADLDGDNDVDLAGAGGNNVSILKNLSNETANQPPTAFIDSIGPDPAEQEETVMFGGHGEDSDGHIVGYSWRSSIDGQLSDQASFTIYNLSAGPHMIYFKVQDDDSTWSPEVSEQLYITPGDGIKVTWVYGEMAYMRQPYTIWLKAQNLGSSPTEFVYGLYEP